MREVKVVHSFPFLRKLFIGFLCLLLLIIVISIVDYYYSKPATNQEKASYTQFLKQTEKE